MTDCDKLLQQAKNSPNNLRFADLCHLAECYGFIYDDRKTSGSHRLYKRPGTQRLMNFQNFDGKAKPFQVKQLLNAIEEIQGTTASEQGGARE